MADLTPTAAELARRLADAMEQHGLPYAIGGALALGYYAPPRATVDVDINIFVPPVEGLDDALVALTSAGFVADEDEEGLLRRAREEGQFHGKAHGMRVDVFVPAIDYYAELEPRCRQVVLLNRPLFILAADDLAVLKMVFDRRKDLADVEELVRAGVVNPEFVRSTLIELVGADDHRLREWQEILDDVAAS